MEKLTRTQSSGKLLNQNEEDLKKRIAELEQENNSLNRQFLLKDTLAYRDILLRQLQQITTGIQLLNQTMIQVREEIVKASSEEEDIPSESDKDMQKQKSKSNKRDRDVEDDEDLEDDSEDEDSDDDSEDED